MNQTQATFAVPSMILSFSFQPVDKRHPVSIYGIDRENNDIFERFRQVHEK